MMEAANLAQAIALIEAHGSDLEKARLRWILHGAPPDPEMVRSFGEAQNEDGGFAFDMTPGNLSTISHTLTALWWLEGLGLLASPAADRACAYLAATQQDDGGWDEDPAIARYPLPPWMAIGDLRARVYLTADAAYYLALTGRGEETAFGAALGFLKWHQNETGSFYGFLHSTWIATSVFLIAGPTFAEIARRGLDALAARPFSTWEDSQIAWALDCLATAGLPRDHPFAEQALAELVRRQRPDGGWSSEDGETHAVGATLQAVKVLKHYGLLPPAA